MQISTGDIRKLFTWVEKQKDILQKTYGCYLIYALSFFILTLKLLRVGREHCTLYNVIQNEGYHSLPEET